MLFNSDQSCVDFRVMLMKNFSLIMIVKIMKMKVTLKMTLAKL